MNTKCDDPTHEELHRRLQALETQVRQHRHTAKRLRQQNAYMDALQEIAVGLIGRRDLNDLLQTVVKRATALIQTGHGFLFLHDASIDRLKLAAGQGLYHDVSGYQVKKGEGLVGHVWQKGEPIVIDHYAQWAGRHPDPRWDPLSVVAGVPVQTPQRFIGVIGLAFTQNERSIAGDDLDILKRFADLAAVAIHNAHLYTELKAELAQRKWAEQGMRDKERFLSAVFDAIQDGISVLDTNLDIVRVNAAISKWYAHMLPLEGKKCFQAFHGKGQACQVCPAQRTLASGRLEMSEVPFTTEQGVVGTLELYAFPMADDTGRPQYVVEYVRDITRRKQNEETLQRYKRMVTASNDFMALIDRNLVYQVVNDRYLQAFNKTYEEVVNHSVADILGPEVLERVRDKLERCLEGEEIHFQLWLDTPGTGRIFADAAYFPIIAADGTVTGVVVIARDATTVKLLEEQLIQAQKMEAIGTLAGGVAHDFNNLLMGVQGRISLLLEDVESTHPFYQALKSMEAHVDSAKDLTRQLLGFARRGKYDVKPTDLNQLMQEHTRMFGRTRKEIRIHGQYADDLWPVDIDAGQIKQVLLNLYVNAWQAMPEGGSLTIRTENTVVGDSPTEPGALRPGRYVKIAVTDTGTGMDEATRRRVFEPFFTTKPKGRGTGLGLAAAYGIVKNHGGGIDVLSVPGQGSTFKVFLPASSRSPSTTPALVPQTHTGKGAILLVDDEDIILDVGRQMVQRLGYEVIVAPGGRQAILKYQQHHDQIDLVILDMIMPGMGGGETFDRLKKIDPEVKVLLSSGYSIDGKAQEIMARGCQGFLQKPFGLHQLSAKIKEILSGF